MTHGRMLGGNQLIRKRAGTGHLLLCVTCKAHYRRDMPCLHDAHATNEARARPTSHGVAHAWPLRIVIRAPAWLTHPGGLATCACGGPFISESEITTRPRVAGIGPRGFELRHMRAPLAVGAEPMAVAGPYVVKVVAAFHHAPSARPNRDGVSSHAYETLDTVNVAPSTDPYVALARDVGLGDLVEEPTAVRRQDLDRSSCLQPGSRVAPGHVIRLSPPHEASHLGVSESIVGETRVLSACRTANKGTSIVRTRLSPLFLTESATAILRHRPTLRAHSGPAVPVRSRPAAVRERVCSCAHTIKNGAAAAPSYNRPASSGST